MRQELIEGWKRMSNEKGDYPCYPPDIITVIIAKEDEIGGAFSTHRDV
jgi:hypothetical protein